MAAIGWLGLARPLSQGAEWSSDEAVLGRLVVARSIALQAA